MSFYPSGAPAPIRLYRKFLALTLGCAVASFAAAEPIGEQLRMQVIGKGDQVEPILAGNYREAISLIERSPATFRTTFSNTNNLCVAYTLSGDYERAEKSCDRAVTISRRQNRLWFNDRAQRNNLATALSNSGVLQVLQQSQPDASGNFEEAERLFEEAVELRAEQPDAVHNLKLLQQSRQMNVASATP